MGIRGSGPWAAGLVLWIVGFAWACREPAPTEGPPDFDPVSAHSATYSDTTCIAGYECRETTSGELNQIEMIVEDLDESESTHCANLKERLEDILTSPELIVVYTNNTEPWDSTQGVDWGIYLTGSDVMMFWDSTFIRQQELPKTVLEEGDHRAGHYHDCEGCMGWSDHYPQQHFDDLEGECVVHY